MPAIPPHCAPLLTERLPRLCVLEEYSIDGLAGSGGTLSSYTYPVELAVYGFAGEKRLVQLADWSSDTSQMNAVLNPTSPTSTGTFVTNNAYPFVDDSSALVWA